LVRTGRGIPARDARAVTAPLRPVFMRCIVPRTGISRIAALETTGLAPVFSI
jgi:hypothetical protein